jgi:hypothetical protein
MRCTTGDPQAASEPRGYAMCANQQIDTPIQHLLNALNAAAEDAARIGVTDTGARRAAAALVDARIAMHQAITAAARALADRDRTVDVPGARLAQVSAA